MMDVRIPFFFSNHDLILWVYINISHYSVFFTVALKQRLHATHNLMELLSAKHPGIPPTLRDDRLSEEVTEAGQSSKSSWIWCWRRCEKKCSFSFHSSLCLCRRSSFDNTTWPSTTLRSQTLTRVCSRCCRTSRSWKTKWEVLLHLHWYTVEGILRCCVASFVCIYIGRWLAFI